MKLSVGSDMLSLQRRLYFMQSTVLTDLFVAIAISFVVIPARMNAHILTSALVSSGQAL